MEQSDFNSKQCRADSKPPHGTKTTGGFSKILICLPASDREKRLCLFLRLQKDVEFKSSDTLTHHTRLEAHLSLINLLVNIFGFSLHTNKCRKGCSFDIVSLPSHSM